MAYSLREGSRRALVRAAKIGLIGGILLFVNNYLSFAPQGWEPLLLALAAFLEKLERNYQENK